MKKIVVIILMLFPIIVGAQIRQEFNTLDLLTGSTSIDTSYQMMVVDVQSNRFIGRISVGQFLQRLTTISNAVGTTTIIDGTITNNDINVTAGISLAKLQSLTDSVLIGRVSGTGVPQVISMGDGVFMRNDSILADVTLTRLVDSLASVRSEITGASGVTNNVLSDSIDVIEEKIVATTLFTVSQSAHGFAVYDAIYYDASDEQYKKANLSESGQFPEFVVMQVVNSNQFKAGRTGNVYMPIHGFSLRQYYFNDLGRPTLFVDSLVRATAFLPVSADTIYLNVQSTQLEPLTPRLKSYTEYDFSQESWITLDSSGWVLSGSDLIGWISSAGDTLDLIDNTGSSTTATITTIGGRQAADLREVNGVFNYDTRNPFSKDFSTFDSTLVMLAVFTGETDGSFNGDAIIGGLGGNPGNSRAQMMVRSGVYSAKTRNGGLDLDSNVSPDTTLDNSRYFFLMAQYNYATDSVFLYGSSTDKSLTFNLKGAQDLYLSGANYTNWSNLGIGGQVTSSGNGSSFSPTAFVWAGVKVASTQIDTSTFFSSIIPTLQEQYNFTEFPIVVDENFQTVGLGVNPTSELKSINFRSTKAISFPEPEAGNIVTPLVGSGIENPNEVKTYDLMQSSTVKTRWGAEYTVKATLEAKDTLHLNGYYKIQLNNGNWLVLDTVPVISPEMFGGGDKTNSTSALNAMSSYQDSIYPADVWFKSQATYYIKDEPYVMPYLQNSDGSLITTNYPTWYGNGATIQSLGGTDTLMVRKTDCGNAFSSAAFGGSNSIIGIDRGLIMNLNFVGVSGDNNVNERGLVLTSTYSFEVHRCKFNNLGIGLEYRFALNARVEKNHFNATDSAMLIFTNGGVLACPTGGENSNSNNSSANRNSVIGNRFVFNQDLQTTALLLKNCDNNYVARNVFEGSTGTTGNGVYNITIECSNTSAQVNIFENNWHEEKGLRSAANFLINGQSNYYFINDLRNDKDSVLFRLIGPSARILHLYRQVFSDTKPTYDLTSPSLTGTAKIYNWDKARDSMAYYDFQDQVFPTHYFEFGPTFREGTDFAQWSSSRGIRIIPRLFLKSRIAGNSGIHFGGSLWPTSVYTESADNLFDVGSASLKWRNGYFGNKLFVNEIAKDAGESQINLDDKLRYSEDEGPFSNDRDIPDIGAVKSLASQTGSGAPTGITPDFIGQVYIDTLTNNIYIAFGTSSGNWTQVNN